MLMQSVTSFLSEKAANSMAADASIAADAEASLLLSELAWSFSPFNMKLIQAFVQSRQQQEVKWNLVQCTLSCLVQSMAEKALR